MFSVYILYSKQLSKYYVGFTGDAVEQRLHEHLVSKKHFTSKAKDWIIVYIEQFSDKTSAMAREKEIKGWKSRKKIEQLISSSTE